MNYFLIFLYEILEFKVFFFKKIKLFRLTYINSSHLKPDFLIRLIFKWGYDNYGLKEVFLG